MSLEQLGKMGEFVAALAVVAVRALMTADPPKTEVYYRGLRDPNGLDEID